LIEHTRGQAEASGALSVEDIRRWPKRLASFSEEVAAQNGRLKRFLFSRLYSQPGIAEDRDRSVAALDALFRFFLEHPERMPKHYAELAKEEPRHRVVCDYIAGMTDHFLLRQCQELLGDEALTEGKD
jgi:dGTPase